MARHRKERRFSGAGCALDESQISALADHPYRLFLAIVSPGLGADRLLDPALRHDPRWVFLAQSLGRFQRRSFDAVINLLRREPPIPEREEPLVAERLLDTLKNLSRGDPVRGGRDEYRPREVGPREVGMLTRELLHRDLQRLVNGLDDASRRERHAGSPADKDLLDVAPVKPVLPCRL